MNRLLRATCLIFFRIFERVKKIISIALIIILIASNIGLSMNTHFCGGKAVETSFSIGIDRLTCGMPQSEKTPLSSETSFQAKPCCEDQHQVLEVDEKAEAKTITSVISVPFLVAYTTLFILPAFAVDVEKPHFPYYSPPIPKQDAQVLFQSFLI